MFWSGRILCVWIVMGASAVAAEEAFDALRLNQIQVVATHNSYHLRPPAAMLKAAIAVRKDAKEWDYSRQSLDEQLDQGIRSFELDLHLSKDGWQVMHVPIFDPGSTVKTFADALQVVRQWSKAHPRHIPISLLLELKEEGYAVSKAFRRPQAADLERLDAVIREVIPSDGLLTPDDVRGAHATLFEAIGQEGWPTLSEAAGKVMVILHERGELRDTYLEGRPALEGRAMFVESDLGQAHSAVLIRNDPTDRRIAELAQEGYLIRTRADSQGRLRAEDRQAALEGGAHLLTTDFPAGEVEPERAFGLPAGAVARVHPLTGPTEHRGKPLNEPLP